MKVDNVKIKLERYIKDNENCEETIFIDGWEAYFANEITKNYIKQTCYLCN